VPAETLDLSGAKTGQFDLLPPNWYEATVYEITDVEIEKDTGKLALGTPGYNVQFAIDGGEYDNRRVFNRFWFPREGEYDEGKRATMIGRFADFLIALGEEESKIKSGKYKFDRDELTGRKVRVSVGIDKTGDYNTVRNFKPVGTDVEEAGII
jgi:hypothetical protein